MDYHNGTFKVSITSYNEEVTGSNNHVKIDWADGRQIAFLVDCGLFQETEHNHHNKEEFPYNPQNISFAIATHVHTDHVGRLPFLIKKGFNGPIYATYETFKMMPIVLKETADRLDDEYRGEKKNFEIEKDARKKTTVKNSRGKGKRDKPRRNIKKPQQTKRLVYPKLIYTANDIAPCVDKVKIQNLYETFCLCEGLDITFYPNAHIGGAVLTVCRVYDESAEQYFLFTGDLGITNPVTKGITDIPKEVADKISVIISESTYGSADYSRNVDEELAKLEGIIKENYRKKGILILMSNSLERPQRYAAAKKEMQQRSKEEYLKAPLFLDTPFGLRCHSMYKKLYGSDYLPEHFHTVGKDDRDNMLMSEGPKEIICTSPRLYQGSFLNYGARMISNPNVTMIFIAYIAENVQNIVNLPIGSVIKFQNEYITKRCKMLQMSCFSSNVSTEEMDLFLEQFPNANTILFNHGTEDSKSNYMQRYSIPYKRHTHGLLFGRTVVLDKDGIVQYY